VLVQNLRAVDGDGALVQQAGLGATGDSGYLAFTAAAGASRLALDRRICCLDDRRQGGELCNTCPRLPRAERLRRLREQDQRNSA
jgi:hypothetical protein